MDFTKSPSFVNFATRELLYPSETKILPSLSHVTSVGRPNVPPRPPPAPTVVNVAGSPCPASSRNPPRQTIDSSFLPRNTRPDPRRLNLITMFEPSSTTHTLSFLSTFTACAKEKPYAPCPHCLTYLPV